MSDPAMRSFDAGGAVHQEVVGGVGGEDPLARYRSIARGPKTNQGKESDEEDREVCPPHAPHEREDERHQPNPHSDGPC